MVNKIDKWGKTTKDIVYGKCLIFRNRNKEKYEWYIEDYLDDLIGDDPGIHPELADEFPGVILEEELSGPVEAEGNNGNGISSASSNNSVIVHNPVLCFGTIELQNVHPTIQLQLT